MYGFVWTNCGENSPREVFRITTLPGVSAESPFG